MALLALQSQEWPSAQLAMHARCPGVSQADVAQAREAERAFVLTWTLRGTLHLVPAADLGWLLELCAPGAIRSSKSRYQQLGLTERRARTRAGSDSNGVKPRGRADPLAVGAGAGGARHPGGGTGDPSSRALCGTARAGLFGTGSGRRFDLCAARQLAAGDNRGVAPEGYAGRVGSALPGGLRTGDCGGLRPLVRLKKGAGSASLGGGRGGLRGGRAFPMARR